MLYIVPYRTFKYIKGEKVYDSHDCKYGFIDWKLSPETEKSFNNREEMVNFVEGNVKLGCPVITRRGETHKRDIIIVDKHYIEFYHSQPDHGGYCVHALYKIHEEE